MIWGAPGASGASGASDDKGTCGQRGSSRSDVVGAAPALSAGTSLGTEGDCRSTRSSLARKSRVIFLRGALIGITCTWLGHAVIGCSAFRCRSSICAFMLGAANAVTASTRSTRSSRARNSRVTLRALCRIGSARRASGSTLSGGAWKKRAAMRFFSSAFNGPWLARLACRLAGRAS